MEILYNQSNLRRTFVLGILLIFIGVLSIFTDLKIYLVGLGGVGIVHLATYFYHKNISYLKLSDDAIIRPGLFFTKAIKVNDVKAVSYFAGDYVVKSPKLEITIDTNLVDKASLSKLHDYIVDLKAIISTV